MSHRGSQLNIRSDFARARVRELSQQTGMTATELIEDALRGYVPPARTKPVGRLIERGGLLVMPKIAGRTITHEEAEAAIEATRNRDLYDDD